MLDKKYIAISLLGLLHLNIAHASVTLHNNDHTFSLGGKLKVDAKYTTGQLAYSNHWTAENLSLTDEHNNFNMFINESRINTKYIKGKLKGYLEYDFVNQERLVSDRDSIKFNLRHAFFKYGDLTVGKTWSNFMNVSSMVESTNYSGALTGQVYTLNTQITYKMGDFRVSLEEPNTIHSDQDTHLTASYANKQKNKFPDVTAKYSFNGDWGNITLAALGRNLSLPNGKSDFVTGASISGSLKFKNASHLQFQYTKGHVGKYVGGNVLADLYAEQPEETTAYMVGYKYHWSNSVRNNLFYSKLDTEFSNKEVIHAGLNFFVRINESYDVGFEIGRLENQILEHKTDYAQLSFIYTL